MPFDLGQQSLGMIVLTFAVCTLIIGFAGTRLAGVAVKLAERTGMGQIIAGALFVGMSTSLPGSVLSVTTAWQGHTDLAIGNALGGIAAQTTFLAIADLFYRKGNLEHAAASATGLAQTTLLVSMLSVPVLAYAGPDWTFLHIHPASILLFIIYGFGLSLLSEIRDEPMWHPKKTDLTEEDAKQDGHDSHPETSARLWAEFLAFALLTAVAGHIIGQAGLAIVAKTGISETAVGTFLTAISTSFPEFVSAIAAVRIGAVNLAVGDIIGGNAFDVLFLAASDIAYREGSIYAAFSNQHLFTIALVILMSGVLLLGMLNRERRGMGNIGWESVAMLALYGASIFYLAG
ncbi:MULTISPECIES: sodium:calcium antiporter [unclassified Thalassospira]|uniref:sodium:calcium antiporter n=1 Tax=unclassified Thalassospira TaxID=2648997 RepID=UPI000EBE06CE|nr:MULTISPECIES: sodium:calcium antiporter [unclassified Thalassospira]MBO6808995.1 sodium:calcium antiporter [Thalassospira sp.]MBO6841979.1 sodium:calcium antiporter [Thalassospira sp.]MBR9902160.1 sodium:calcium antiporter [Rhodospirillales bacterium]HAI29169.1 cation transporter [Thalassospira sp.]|tara:strand:- start:5151 stop:6188 length:1038 start_codon:yes stop_codon:yes gene_type:complete